MSDASQPLDHPATRSTVEGNFQSYEGTLEHFGRTLDPVRAAALERAIAAVPWPEDGPCDTRKIIEVARAFEDYLAGDD